MSEKTYTFTKGEQKSEIIRNLYIALFTKNALSNVCMTLTMHYLDADTSKIDPNWEGTAAFSLLAAVTWLNSVKTKELIEDSGTLNAFSDCVQSEVSTFVENYAKRVGLNAKWLTEILLKCQQNAKNVCLAVLEDEAPNEESLTGVTALAAKAYKSTCPQQLTSLKTQFLVAEAFTLKAVEQFTRRVEEMHRRPKPSNFSYFECFKETAPLIWVAGMVYKLTADKEIATPEDFENYIAQIRRQFSVTDGVSAEATAICNELLELCLGRAKDAGQVYLSFKQTF